MFVVRSNPSVAYLFPAGLDWLLEQGLCKYSVFFPVGSDSGPVGGCQALVRFILLDGFLIWGSPHEVSIGVFGVVAHKYIGCPESRVGYIPSDLGNDPWLDR